MYYVFMLLPILFMFKLIDIVFNLTYNKSISYQNSDGTERN
ncbi:MAG: hypothetical protein ACRC6E_14830 [Fusobacteriaceae bacterium]